MASTETGFKLIHEPLSKIRKARYRDFILCCPAQPRDHA